MIFYRIAGAAFGALSTVIHPFINITLMSILMVISCIFAFSVFRLFDTCFKQIANGVMELSLGGVVIGTNIVEYIDIGQTTRDELGRAFVIFFYLVQVSIMLICMAESLTDLFHYCVKRVK